MQEWPFFQDHLSSSRAALTIQMHPSESGFIILQGSRFLASCCFILLFCVFYVFRSFDFVTTGRRPIHLLQMATGGSCRTAWQTARRAHSQGYLHLQDLLRPLHIKNHHKVHFWVVDFDSMICYVDLSIFSRY